MLNTLAEDRAVEQPHWFQRQRDNRKPGKTGNRAINYGPQTGGGNILLTNEENFLNIEGEKKSDA